MERRREVEDNDRDEGMDRVQLSIILEIIEAITARTKQETMMKAMFMMDTMGLRPCMPTDIQMIKQAALSIALPLFFHYSLNFSVRPQEQKGFRGTRGIGPALHASLRASITESLPWALTQPSSLCLKHLHEPIDLRIPSHFCVSQNLDGRQREATRALPLISCFLSQDGSQRRASRSTYAFHHHHRNDMIMGIRSRNVNCAE